MHILWPERMRYNDVLLHLSNTAPYIVKTGNEITIFYPEVIYVMCIVNGFTA